MNAKSTKSSTSALTPKRILAGCVAIIAIAVGGWMAYPAMIAQEGMVPVAGEPAKPDATVQRNAATGSSVGTSGSATALPGAPTFQNTEKGRIRPTDSR